MAAGAFNGAVLWTPSFGRWMRRWDLEGICGRELEKILGRSCSVPGVGCQPTAASCQDQLLRNPSIFHRHDCIKQPPLLSALTGPTSLTGVTGSTGLMGPNSERDTSRPILILKEPPSEPLRACHFLQDRRMTGSHRREAHPSPEKLRLGISWAPPAVVSHGPACGCQKGCVLLRVCFSPRHQH